MQNNPPCSKHGKVYGYHDWLSWDSPHPKDAACLKNKCIHHEIKQVLVGHCRLNQHLQEIVKKPSATCECEIEEESVYHIFFCIVVLKLYN